MGHRRPGANLGSAGAACRDLCEPCRTQRRANLTAIEIDQPGIERGGQDCAPVTRARAAADHAESAGALLSSTFQVAIAAGAVLGGLIIDSLDSQAVIVYAATAAFAGAALMFIRGRAIERQHG